MFVPLLTRGILTRLTYLPNERIILSVLQRCTAAAPAAVRWATRPPCESESPALRFVTKPNQR